MYFYTPVDPMKSQSLYLGLTKSDWIALEFEI